MPLSFAFVLVGSPCKAASCVNISTGIKYLVGGIFLRLRNGLNRDENVGFNVSHRGASVP